MIDAVIRSSKAPSLLVHSTIFGSTIATWWVLHYFNVQINVFQAGVWQNLLTKGIDDVVQPAAFKLAIVLRHTPSELTVKLLSELLRLHPQSVSWYNVLLGVLKDCYFILTCSQLLPDKTGIRTRNKVR